ncbi:hypothetical protein BpHYR1_051039 [Brachionus plicatilis]|uniref:Uncharacterized protein n=1 Tax=Brachionus plicatilis TaxID=10195 RepID=A0A3M7SUR7_BRAPC|nr:hypothetical protein BpHYR1_051039 [Brachionus plicatilis]
MSGNCMASLNSRSTHSKILRDTIEVSSTMNKLQSLNCCAWVDCILMLLTDVLVVGIGILNLECIVCPPPINRADAIPVNAVRIIDKLRCHQHSTVAEFNANQIIFIEMDLRWQIIY